MIDRRKQVVAGLLTLAVLIVVFVGLFPKIADYGAAWESIQDMSLGSVAALVAVMVLNVIVYVFPYQAALPGIPYSQAFVVRQTSFMISNAIPAGGAFGLGVQYAMLSGYGFPPAATSSAIAATSVWNLLVTLALPAVGVAAIVFTGDAGTAEIVGAVVGLVAVGLLVALLVLVLRSESTALRVGHLGDRLAAPVMRRINRAKNGASSDATPDMASGVGGSGSSDEPVTAAVINFRDNLRTVVEDRWGLLTITSVAQQFCQFLILAVAFFGITGSHGGINPVQLFAAFSIARLAGFIPITPGGLGTVDAAMVALMVSMGADRDTALAASLLWRAASFVPQVVLGIVTFVVWRHNAGSGKAKGSADPAKA
ncbi:MAG: YbhN family protein [Microthrixaceae bacterium]|nr:YbhN family protein [Microthrixaceae bacterium]